MTASEDGWQPARLDPGSGQLVWITVPGTTVSLQVMRGTPQTIMGAVAADFNGYVEPLRDPDSASYTPTNSVATSNHLNGTAMDLNWNSHPFQTRGTFSADQMSAIREILDFYEGWIFWAGDWNAPVDEMHWQLGYNTWNREADAADFIARKIGADGFSTLRRVPAPAPAPNPNPTPAPVPTPDPPAPVVTGPDPVAVLVAATGLSTAKATEILPTLSQGLALAQCSNVNRIAMFIAQTRDESDNYNATEEYANGDTSTDRWKYKGRTWIQITWQSNYAAFGQWAASHGLIDDPNQFVNDPASLADIKWAGIGAAWYWTVQRPNINAMCDAGDINGVTYAINGGYNGLDKRAAYWNQALAQGNALLSLLTITPSGGPLMALTDDEQRELLSKTREIWDQLRGPGGNGWPQLGNETPVDALAEVKKGVEGLVAGVKGATPDPKAQQ